MVTTGFGKLDLPSDIRVTDVEVDSQGRIVVGATTDSPSYLVLRLLPDGSFDPAFADGGRLELGFGSRVELNSEDGFYVAGPVGKRGPGREVRLSRYLPDGAIDSSFGGDGKVVSKSILDNDVSDLAVQPSGKVMVFTESFCHATSPDCGFSYFVALAARYSPSGKWLSAERTGAERLGTVIMKSNGSFVIGGSTSEGEGSVIARLAQDGSPVSTSSFPYEDMFLVGNLGLQSDSRLVSNRHSEISRFESDDRTLDPTFDETQPVCAGSPFWTFSGEVVVLPDDRLLLASACGVARLLADGGIDTTFGASGLVLLPASDRPYVLRRDNDGSILLATGGLNSLTIHRLNPDGAVDPAFGTGGATTIPLELRVPTPDGAEALTVDSKGRLVAAGFTICRDPSCRGLALTRYLRNGRLDRRFGTDGRVTTPGRDLQKIRSIVDLPNGSLLVTGLVTRSGPGDTTDEIFLARYRPSGALDTSFGDMGIVTTQASKRPKGDSYAYGIALQEDGKAVVAGYATECGFAPLCVLVARYRKDGNLDAGFGKDGLVLFRPRGKYPAVGQAVAVREDGRIVVTGGDGGRFMVARLNRGGSFDRSFGGDGVVTTASSPWGPARALTLGRGGSVTIAGGPDFSRNVIVRFRGNGRVDRRFGNSGRVTVPGIGITDLAVTRCGLFATGTGNTREGRRSMAVARVSGSGVARNYRYPFGRRADSYGKAAAPVDGRRNLVIAGRYELLQRRGDFALAKVRTAALAPGCTAP